jgi:growth arrest-specific protein 8
LADSLEKKEAQLNEVLSASNLDPASLSVVTRKLEVTRPSDSFSDRHVALRFRFRRSGSARRQEQLGASPSLVARSARWQLSFI